MEILEKSVWINIVYRTWQGEVTMSREEIKRYSNPDLLPPEDLIKPGSKAITDVSKLTKIKSFGRKVRRECEKVSLSAFGNYGTSLEASESLIKRLEQMQAEHQAMVNDYLDGYEQTTEQWISEHPEFEGWLRHSKLSRKDIESRFKFEFDVFQIQPTGDNSPQYLKDNLSNQVSGLLGTLLSEIETMAESAWTKTYVNNDSVSQKALSPIRTILKKLDTLKFIHSNVFRLVERVQVVLNAMPKSGPISGSDLSAVCGLLNLLSSSSRMMDFMNTASKPVGSLLGAGMTQASNTVKQAEQPDLTIADTVETEQDDSAIAVSDDLATTSTLEAKQDDVEILSDDLEEEVPEIIPQTTPKHVPSLAITF